MFRKLILPTLTILLLFTLIPILTTTAQTDDETDPHPDLTATINLIEGIEQIEHYHIVPRLGGGITAYVDISLTSPNFNTEDTALAIYIAMFNYADANFDEYLPFYFVAALRNSETQSIMYHWLDDSSEWLRGDVILHDILENDPSITKVWDTIGNPRFAREEDAGYLMELFLEVPPGLQTETTALNAYIIAFRVTENRFPEDFLPFEFSVTLWDTINPPVEYNWIEDDSDWQQQMSNTPTPVVTIPPATPTLLPTATLQPTNTLPPPPPTQNMNSDAATCGGATTCGEMTSCEQAYACLRDGRSSLDRDSDGVPCESICPGG